MFDFSTLQASFGGYTIVLSAIMSFVLAIPAYFLWNWLMPDIFALKVITFWQAWGMVFLAKCIFKL